MKTILKSKTMWAGAAVTVLGLLEQFDVTTIVEGNSGIITIVIGIAIIILRNVTKEAIQ
jgi:hypothetical protein